MARKDILTKILAIIGTVLVWLPLLAPVLFSLVRFVQGRVFLLDYLMPAELFLVVLVGGLTLLWAAFRVRSRRGLFCWGLGIAAGMLGGGMVLAEVSGLASGEIEPKGVWWALVTASIILYTLAVAFIGVSGLFLLRDLFKAPGPSSGEADR